MALYFQTLNVLAYLLNWLQLKLGVLVTSCHQQFLIYVEIVIYKNTVLEIYFQTNCSIAISFSYKIFNARSSELWDITELLTVF